MKAVDKIDGCGSDEKGQILDIVWQTQQDFRTGWIWVWKKEKSDSENVLVWQLGRQRFSYQLLCNKLPPKLSGLKQPFVLLMILSQDLGKSWLGSLSLLHVASAEDTEIADLAPRWLPHAHLVLSTP